MYTIDDIAPKLGFIACQHLLYLLLFLSILFLNSWFQKKMLSKVGGKETRPGIYLMLPRIMTAKCAYNYNVTGKSSTKKDFRELKIHSLILGMLPSYY